MIKSDFSISETFIHFEASFIVFLSASAHKCICRCAQFLPIGNNNAEVTQAWYYPCKKKKGGGFGLWALILCFKSYPNCFQQSSIPQWGFQIKCEIQYLLQMASILCIKIYKTIEQYVSSCTASWRNYKASVTCNLKEKYKIECPENTLYKI